MAHGETPTRVGAGNGLRRSPDVARVRTRVNDCPAHELDMSPVLFPLTGPSEAARSVAAGDETRRLRRTHTETAAWVTSRGLALSKVASACPNQPERPRAPDGACLLALDRLLELLLAASDAKQLFTGKM